MELDDDLAAWAAAVRLPESEADAIFERIIATPALAAAPTLAAPTAAASTTPAPNTPAKGLDPSWWREFNSGFATRMITSTRPARRRAA